jgi:hypothetical protein
VTEQVQLHADVPHEAAQIISQIVGDLPMSGLTGKQAAILIQSIQTVCKALSEPAKAAEGLA